MNSVPPRFWQLFAASWAVAMVVAVGVDRPVAVWVKTSGSMHYVQNAHVWPEVIKAPGNFFTNLGVVVLLCVFRRIDWRRACVVVLSGAFSGLNAAVKWCFGRYRPFRQPGPTGLHPFDFHPFLHGLRGLTEANLSFPSGHECTAAALALGLLVAYRPAAWVLLPWAILVGIERVAENAHYTSDVIAAVGLAAIGVRLVLRVVRPRFTVETDFPPV